MNKDYAQDSALGKGSQYDNTYSPDLLFPIARADYRATIDNYIESAYGHDLWQCYELSWLNSQGLPQVACANILVPINSAVIVESKSLKLYLNSFFDLRFDSSSAVKARLEEDLSSRIGIPVEVEITSASAKPLSTSKQSDDSSYSEAGNQQAILLDTLDIDCEQYERDAQLLQLDQSHPQVVDQLLCSHLLRSHCPVTNQPDWGTLSIRYTGKAIDHASLLRYIVSFRQHCGFHEQCVEQIYADIMLRCEPSELTVYAQYTRRGGIDINPLRSSIDKPLFSARIWRQ